MAIIVTEKQVIQAMQYWEDRAGGFQPGRHVLPDECSELADLLCAMRWHKEDVASLADDSRVAQLIKQAGITADIPTTTISASQP